MINVLISVLNWNNYSETIACIESIKKLSYSNYFILITDNASYDDSVQKIRNYDDKLFIHENKENLGYAAGHLFAVKYAKTKEFDAIWILNNDTRADKYALEALIKAFKNNKNAVYGSVIVNPNNKKIKFGGSYQIKFGEIDYSQKWNFFEGQKLSELKTENVLEVADVNGASIFIPIQIINKYGFMPTDYFMYSEETHFCYSLRERGVSSYIAYESKVEHLGSTSFSNEVLMDISIYYRKRNSLFFENYFNKIGRRNIRHIIFKPVFLFSFLFKSILFKLGVKQFYNLKYYFMQLAVWHFFINKKGKTIAPEKYL